MMRTFDRVSGLVISFSVGFSLGVALGSWEWFPTEGDWGHIATIPPSFLNYTALLLPWLVLLAYLLARRLILKRPL